MDVTSADPRHVLQSVFGYDSFRPHQGEIIERITRGRNALVIMPTGGGKSLCYQIPALVRDGVGIVVSPLISLMQDQVDALQQLGIRAAVLNSSLSASERRIVEAQFAHGELDLCYVAPERVMRDRFIAAMKQTNVALIAIDEAHCISQWGHDFRPEYLQLSTLRETFPHVPTIGVTATADPPTQEVILERLHMSEDDLFVTGFDRPNINYRVVPKKRNPKQQLLQFIESEHRNDDSEHRHDSGIVYCLSRKRVESTAKFLADQGYEALPYHAGLSGTKREEHQDRFLREPGLIMVATVAFGMGIDKPDVRFVAHLDVPKTMESYYQETGRAGRDGHPSNAWMAYRLSDIVRMRKIIQSSTDNEEYRWAQHHKLNALFGYCETTDCRRRVILNYFGETDLPVDCGNCDNCLRSIDTWDGTVAAQKVLSCIARTGQRFGASHITDVIRGADTEKVRKFGHNDISTYGIGSERSKQAWRSIIRQLVAKGMVHVDITGYGSLKLDESCRPVLRGNRDVEFRHEPEPVSKRSSTKTAKRSNAPESGEARDLFDALREVRTKLAREQDVPPYVVFGDKTLLAMVEHRPTTPKEFRQLHGVGDVKLERYADAFLDVVRTFQES
ncbi:DNA helicase RecQ [Longibacter salinarum]|uniref:DNA helicase RecQ n=1 Tax=Longibacter salinarum TaxID=1850348 RepID=A0A2A8D100_9BACT|nr:DNA helicase RecQ [Longibacter salinarum]PEN14487.1 DNA helicase RecQ [Longibacter salinarum]